MRHERTTRAPTRTYVFRIDNNLPQHARSLRIMLGAVNGRLSHPRISANPSVAGDAHVVGVSRKALEICWAGKGVPPGATIDFSIESDAPLGEIGAFWSPAACQGVTTCETTAERPRQVSECVDAVAY